MSIRDISATRNGRPPEFPTPGMVPPCPSCESWATQVHKGTKLKEERKRHTPGQQGVQRGVKPHPARHSNLGEAKLE